jgi:hypothetical protein
MCLLNEIRLSIDIQNAVRIPVMTRSSDQIRGAEICGLARFCVFGVYADIEPGVDALSEVSRCGSLRWGEYSLPSTRARRSAARSYPPYTLSLSRSGVGGIELYLPLGKAHVHHCCLEFSILGIFIGGGTFYVRIIHLQDVHDQRWTGFRSNLVRPLLCAS